MSVRRILTTLLASLVLLPAISQANERVRLQLNAAHGSSFIGYYMAIEQGFYQDEGLNVELLTPVQGRSVTDQLGAAQAEYATGTANSLLAVHQGAPARIIAAIQQSAPDILMMQTSFSSLEQVRGQRLMLAKPPESLATQLLLKRFDISVAPPTLPPFTSVEEAFGQGILDAISGSLLTEPLALQGQFNSISPAQYGIHMYSGLLMASTTEIKRHTERVRRFIDASLRGWQYALEHSQESIALLQNRYSVPHSSDFLRHQLHSLRELINPNLIPVGQLSEMRMNSIQKMLREQGFIEQILPAHKLMYDARPSPLLNQVMMWLAPAAFIVLVMTAFILRLLSLNKLLQQEIAERRQSEARVLHLATHDSLTGLANRVALKEKLELLVSLARRNTLNPVVIFIDLDGFKEVNDQFGHNAGDDILRQFSERTSSRLRDSDTFGRLAGDEFLILMPDSGQQGYHQVVTKVQEALETPFLIEGENVFLSVSIGIAVYRNHQETADQLLMRADHAMYDVKHNGKDNIVVAQAFMPKDDTPMSAMQTTVAGQPPAGN